MNGLRLVGLVVLICVFTGCESEKPPSGIRDSAVAYLIVDSSGKPGLRLIVSDSYAACDAARTPYWTIDLDIDPAQAYEKAAFAFQTRSLSHPSTNLAYKNLGRAKVSMVTKGSLILAPRRVAHSNVMGSFEFVYIDKPADRYEEVTFSAKWCGRFQDYLGGDR
jgi:hypothetical protein